MRARTPALDRFRVLAAVLVLTIHTSPLASYAPGAMMTLLAASNSLSTLAFPMIAFLP